jgi:hypothetical protein
MTSTFLVLNHNVNSSLKWPKVFAELPCISTLLQERAAKGCKYWSSNAALSSILRWLLTTTLLESRSESLTDQKDSRAILLRSKGLNRGMF